MGTMLSMIQRREAIQALKRLTDLDFDDALKSLQSAKKIAEAYPIRDTKGYQENHLEANDNAVREVHSLSSNTLEDMSKALMFLKALANLSETDLPSIISSVTERLYDKRVTKKKK